MNRYSLLLRLHSAQAPGALLVIGFSLSGEGRLEVELDIGDLACRFAVF